MSAEVGEILVPRSIPGACFDDLRQIKAGAIDFSDDSENEEQVT